MNSAFMTDYELECSAPQRLYSALAERHIGAQSIEDIGGRVRLSVRLAERRRFLGIANELGLAVKVIREGVFCRLLHSVRRRMGLIVGAVICAAAITAAQYFLLTVDILTDSEDIRREVMNILEEDGVTIGTYLPSFNCVELERDLKQRAKGVAWAGVSITDSRLIIDVTERAEKPESAVRRLPCDLVAKHSGTIDRIELYDGLLMIPKGSGVLRGDVLASGRIPVTRTEEKDGKTVEVMSERYVRSIGTFYGTYTEVRTFFQPYAEPSLIMDGRRDDRSYLEFFGAEIPLFIGGEKGLFREEEDFSPLVVLDTELPVGIKRVKREGYGFSMTIYTREQAAVRADEKRQTYEDNFLCDEEILSRISDTEYTDEGVKLTVTYELYGVMSEEKEFFIKK